MKDLVQEGRQIQETFNKKMVNEFSPMGKIHTALDIYLDGVDRLFPSDHISENTRSMIRNRVLQLITKFAEKYNGKVTAKYSPATIEWDYEMKESEFNKIYDEIKNSVENVFNPYLFGLETSGFHYKATGILGTPINKGKITKWLTKQYRDPSPEGSGTSFGEGEKYQKAYRNFVRNLQKTLPKFDNKKMDYKIGRIVSGYFSKNPQAVVRKTDWFKAVKPEIEKLFK